MLPFLLLLGSAEKYPLILGVDSETFIPNPSVLGVQGILPESVCLFVIDQFEEAQISNIRDLSNWANAREVCNGVGKAVQFPVVDSNIFNVMSTLKELYPNPMMINAANECPCKINHFRSGLVIVRVPDNEIGTVSEVVSKLEPNVAIIFVASTPTLFQ